MQRSYSLNYGDLKSRIQKAGAILVRNKKHEIWEFPAFLVKNPSQRMLVCSKTPSDHRSILKFVTDCRRILIDFDKVMLGTFTPLSANLSPSIPSVFETQKPTFKSYGDFSLVVPDEELTKIEEFLPSTVEIEKEVHSYPSLPTPIKEPKMNAVVASNSAPMSFSTATSPFHASLQQQIRLSRASLDEIRKIIKSDENQLVTIQQRIEANKTNLNKAEQALEQAELLEASFSDLSAIASPIGLSSSAEIPQRKETVAEVVDKFSYGNPRSYTVIPMVVKYFQQNPNKIYSTDQILDHLKGNGVIVDRTKFSAMMSQSLLGAKNTPFMKHGRGEFSLKDAGISE